MVPQRLRIAVTVPKIGAGATVQPWGRSEQTMQRWLERWLLLVGPFVLQAGASWPRLVGLPGC